MGETIVRKGVIESLRLIWAFNNTKVIDIDALRLATH